MFINSITIGAKVEEDKSKPSESSNYWRNATKLFGELYLSSTQVCYQSVQVVRKKKT